MKFILAIASILVLWFPSFGQDNSGFVFPDSTQNPYLTKYSISIHGGVGFRTGKPIELARALDKDFAKQLNFGYTLNIQPTYFITKTLGIGLVANLFLTQANGSLELIRGEKPFENLTQTDGMLFFGPSVSGRYFYEKFHLSYSFFGGVQSYASELKGNINNQDRTSKIVGASWATGVNFEVGYLLSKSLSATFSANYMFSLINKAELTDYQGTKYKVTLKDEDRENTSRFGLYLGINYRF